MKDLVEHFVGVSMHGPKLQHCELAAMLSKASLSVEDRAFAGCLNEAGDESQDG
jgi:hypothetical protein